MLQMQSYLLVTTCPLQITPPPDLRLHKLAKSSLKTEYIPVNRLDSEEL